MRYAVDAFAGTSKIEVGVFERGGPPSALAPREGIYEGSAWLVGAGMHSRTTEDTLPSEVARLKLTLQARVFVAENGHYTVAFNDPRGAVFPDGSVGTLSVDTGADTWKLSVPSRQYLGNDVDVVPDGEIDVHATETMTGGSFKGGLLAGDVVGTFDGITTPAYSPFVRWHVSLTRTGATAVGDTAPPVATRAVSDAGARASKPLAEENEASSHIFDFDQLLGPEQTIGALCPYGTRQLVDSTNNEDARGDLGCAAGGNEVAFATTLGTLLQRGDYLDDCMRAFDPSNTSWGGASPCANRARAVSAIAFGLATDRNRALGTESNPNLGQSLLGSRALQLWLGAESILGADPNRIALLGPLLPGGTDVDKLRYYSNYGNAFAALRRSIGGWDVVLHPRIGVGLAAMAPAALEDPDYRKIIGPSAVSSGGEQSIGLPVNILATLTSQLEGVGGLVDALANDRITGQDAQTYAVEVAHFMPRSVVLFAMAQGLRDAARSNGTESWENSWLSARAKYGTSLAKLSVDLKALESNQNPLGIADDDLPLYRLGDQDGRQQSLLGRGRLVARPRRSERSGHRRRARRPSARRRAHGPATRCRRCSSVIIRARCRRPLPPATSNR